MPKIPELDVGNLGLQPSEIGIEAQAAAARRLGGFASQNREALAQTGHTLGSAIQAAGNAGEDIITHRQIAQGSATFAALTSEMTDEWNKAAKNADPNDASIAGQFIEKTLNPKLQTFAESFSTEKGQDWAQQHVAALRQHMVEKTDADMMTRASQAVHVNVANTVNQLSNTVYKDPSGLDFALKTLDTSVGGLIDSSPNLKGTAASAVKTEVSEKAREQIVKSAALGYIEKTGNVPTWASDPAYSKYINGVELKQFQKAADAQKKANLYYERQTETLQRQQDDLKLHKDLNDVFTSSVSVDPNNPNHLLIAPDMMQKVLNAARSNGNAPSAGPSAKTYLDWIESQTRARNEAVVTDPATMSALTAGITDPNKPTTEYDVLQAEATRKISPRDGTILREMVKTVGPQVLHDPVVHETLTAAKSELVMAVPGLAGKDIAGEANYAKFLQSFVPDYLAKKRAGTLDPNALDIKDPNSMISKAMAPFKRSVSQRMTDYMSSIGGEGAAIEASPAPGGVALPPVADRKAGQVYPTARGNMKWTGTGWVQP